MGIIPRASALSVSIRAIRGPMLSSPTIMKRILLFLLVALAATVLSAADAPKPIKALMITGGGYHDYAAQKQTLAAGISARINIEWTILDEGTTREHEHSAFKNPDWAKGYDVVVH